MSPALAERPGRAAHWQSKPIYDPANPLPCGDPAPLRVDHRTGVVTFGGGPGWEGPPMSWPVDYQLAAPLAGFYRGYVVRDDDGRPIDRRMVALASGAPVPQPPGSVAAFGQAGARVIAAVDLYSVEEPGYPVRLEAGGKHSMAAVDHLMNAALNHAETADGHRGFLYPVILIRPGGELYSHGVVRFFGFEIVDWLHEDGARLLSREAARAAD